MIPSEIRANPWIQFLSILLAVVSGVFCVYWLSDVIAPFLIAFILAYILDPGVDLLQKYLSISRLSAILLILVVSTVIVVGFGYYLTDQAIQFGQEIRRIVNNPPDIQRWIDQYAPHPLDDYLRNILDTVQSGDLFEEVWTYLWDNLSAVETSLTQGSNLLVLFASRTMGFIGLLINSVVILFSTIYFLLDFDRIIEGIRSYIPPRYRDTTDQFFQEIDQIMMAFLRGHMVVCVIAGTLYGSGYLLVGLRGGFLIGFLTGLLNVIPYLGPFIGFLLTLTVALIQFGFSEWLLAIVLVFVLVQSVEGNLLTPNIVGGAVGLNPVAVLFALMVFGKLMGFIGLLIALPVSAILKVILNHALHYYRQSNFFRESTSNP